MGDQGFPPRLDIFKQMAQEPTVQRRTDGGLHTRKTWAKLALKLSQPSPKGFLKVWSNSDRQRALAGSPGPIADFLQLKKVSKEFNLQHENIYNRGRH